MEFDEAAPLEIVVNGKPQRVAAGLNVLTLLHFLGLDASRVAVELDGRIVSKPDWERTPILAGARLEIVHFVGGG